MDAAGGLLLPLATHAEFAGSFTNFAGRTQRVAPALSPWGSARPAYAYGLELAAACGTPFAMPAPGLQAQLARIWEQCLPPGTELQPVDWPAVPADELEPAAHRTAEPTTKDPRSGSGAIVWRS